VALLQKETCDLMHFMHFRHPLLSPPVDPYEVWWREFLGSVGGFSPKDRKMTQTHDSDTWWLLQCVAVCYSVLRCVAVCCSVLPKPRYPWNSDHTTHTHTHTHTRDSDAYWCLSWAKLTWQGVRAKFRAKLTRLLWRNGWVCFQKKQKRIRPPAITQRHSLS